MKAFLLDLLICPCCLPLETPIVAKVRRQVEGDIIEAELRCRRCGQVYDVREGVGRFLPKTSIKQSKTISRYESERALSSYLWAHYGEFLHEQGATGAYGLWSSLITQGSGLGIDAGCAVGRFSFEMASKCEVVVGVDASEAFVRTARTLMLNRKISAYFPIEGHICRKEVIELPDVYNLHNVEFIVADVEAFPFASDVARVFASLNVIDKISHPLRHISEMNRLMVDQGAQCLFSDPFSWSDEVTEATQWLGGKDSGPFSGQGLDNLERLFRGEKGLVIPPFTIEKKGNVWWKIRNHENHYELIRSWYIKATR